MVEDLTKFKRHWQSLSCCKEAGVCWECIWISKTTRFANKRRKVREGGIEIKWRKGRESKNWNKYWN